MSQQVTAVRVPSADQIRSARITDFMQWLQRKLGREFVGYEELWKWSADAPDEFWDAIRLYLGVPFHGSWPRVLAQSQMPGARWFPGATVNYAEQVFTHATDARPAIVFGGEDGTLREISWRELEADVGALAAWLRDAGVGPGDRVAAYLPNIPQTVVAFLAVATVGAVWSVCAPDMGSAGVLDRFRQIEPMVLITADGYVNAGRRFDRTGVIAELLRGLPTVTHVVWVPNIDAPQIDLDVPVAVWGTVTTSSRQPEPLRVPFEHPLWIVYSSGTTGLPKAIVHGHGGIMLEHSKLSALQNDLGPHDRFFWYSSTGWIMWNLQIAGLLIGTTICLFDGSPGGSDAAAPDLNTLWRFADRAGVTFFGAGAAFHASCLNARLAPAQAADLSRIRAVGSTGSPLAADVEQWIYQAIGPQIWVAPMSGGTDFASAFVGSSAILPSYLGEMQCRCLGAKVEVWNEAGEPVVDEVGELVCTAPMPSMPLRFWNDAGDRRYVDSYFDMFPGVWRHGDWMRLVLRSEAVGAVIYGRSDATINRHGIRMGTAELYRAVESLPEILDSLVVDLEYLGRESYMPLFVVLQPGETLDAALIARINAQVRSQLSPRHVPNETFAVPEIPRTLTGKKLELPVKKLLLGEAAEKVLNRDAVANPGSLDWFLAFSRQYQRHQDPSNGRGGCDDSQGALARVIPVENLPGPPQDARGSAPPPHRPVPDDPN
jgi:acetoacetyl-CoA synthetase